jgi:hypothetical protein
MFALHTSAAAIVLAVVLCATGCGPNGPGIATVEGVVTMDGEPLENASIVFTPAAGGRW